MSDHLFVTWTKEFCSTFVTKLSNAFCSTLMAKDIYRMNCKLLDLLPLFGVVPDTWLFKVLDLVNDFTFKFSVVDPFKNLDEMKNFWVKTFICANYQRKLIQLPQRLVPKTPKTKRKISGSLLRLYV